MAETEQVEWVSRVLGVSGGAKAGGGGEAALREAAARWRDASDAVDAQIAQLQQALRGSKDTELQEIGQYGMNAVTGNFRVPLMAALAGAQQGNAQDQSKLVGAIARFRSHLESDERVEACDDNPFGVAVSLRGTLIPALDELARSLGG